MINLNLWDIGKVHRALDAQNKNIIIPKLFIRNSDAAIIFLDCSKKDKDFDKSLSGALRWRKFINKASEQIGNRKPLKWMLSLTKSDLITDAEKELQIAKIKKYLKLKTTVIDDIEYSSAKNGENVNESIAKLAFSVIRYDNENDLGEEQKEDKNFTPSFKQAKIKKSSDRRSVAEQDLAPYIAYEAKEPIMVSQAQERVRNRKSGLLDEVDDSFSSSGSEFPETILDL